MPTLTFLPQGAAAAVPAGTPLLDAAAAAGVLIHAPCGGEGTCGACRCRVASGSVVHETNGCLSPEESAAGWVLACQSRVSGDATLEIIETAEEGAQIVTEELSCAPGATRPARDGCQPPAAPKRERGGPEPLAVKRRVKVAPPSAENSFSDFERLTRALRAHAEFGEVTCGAGVLRKLAAVLRAAPVPRGTGGTEPEVTVTLVPHVPSGEKSAEIIQIEAGDTTARAVGVAIDIGTTTCAAQLVDLVSGSTIATASDYNGQLVRGLDVISRINYAQAPARREELRRLVLQTLNALLEKLCRLGALRPDEISNAAVAGNPTMIHLLLGLDPEHLRLAPYTPTVNRLPPLRAREVGLGLHPEAVVIFAPGVGSYVGGDITAGLLQTALATGAPAVRLFLDIGTNGEVVVGNGEWLLACACSAGPAFEGCGVGCGMRAAKGAIERFKLDPRTGRAELSVVGGGKPRGICGSGLIDLLAELFRHGWIDPSGKFNAARAGARLVPPVPRGTGATRRAVACIVVPKEETETGRPILLDERDIQNLLRTKAAVYSACTLMLKAAGLEPGALEQVCVAGGFGRYLDLEKSIRIGLLPYLPLERFTYLGNSSLAGARAMLLSAAARAKVDELAGRMTYLELNTEPAYMDEYTAALFLPHTDASRFPSVAGGPPR